MHYILYYHKIIITKCFGHCWVVFFDIDMQTSTNKHGQESIVDAVFMHSGVIEGVGSWAWISLVYMHSGVIEGEQVCGHGSAWVTCIPV